MNLHEQETYERRFSHFEDPIRLLGYNNPLVREVMERYARGIIITKEEALCQMVVGLNKDWSDERRRHYEMVMQTCFIPGHGRS